jgi:Uma2 family endonuclease
MTVTEEQYLVIDRAAEFRSEFLDGEIIAMSAGSRRHSSLQLNLAGEVRDALRGTRCRAFSADLRVRVSLLCTRTPNYVHAPRPHHRVREATAA